MQITITMERPDSADATALITELDAHLEPIYPQESRHGYSVQKLIDEAVAFFVLRDGATPAACGGVKLFGAEYAEIKRMYVRPQFRGRGYAKRVLEHLTEYSRGQGVLTLRLETGIYQLEAIGLYERMGFYQIPPFGPYRVDPLSRCYEKRLR
ncbi:MAG: N-acetyltransferase [Chloroflexi bacterium]|nr:MAG: N-acetyltransferase [Chloroflexota bacterium]